MLVEQSEILKNELQAVWHCILVVSKHMKFYFVRERDIYLFFFSAATTIRRRVIFCGVSSRMFVEFVGIPLMNMNGAIFM